jgi:hypothetical protein
MHAGLFICGRSLLVIPLHAGGAERQQPSMESLVTCKTSDRGENPPVIRPVTSKPSDRGEIPHYQKPATICMTQHKSSSNQFPIYLRADKKCSHRPTPFPYTLPPRSIFPHCAHVPAARARNITICLYSVTDIVGQQSHL